MERESLENSTSSSLEHSKLGSITPHFRPLHRSKVVDAKEQTSYLALLTDGAESLETQLGPSFPRPPPFVPLRNSNFDAQPPYWMPNGMPTTPTTIRPMASQGTQNGINLEGSTVKRKTVCKDGIAPNPTIWNLSGCDQGYDSSSYRFTVYDERYQALGLPVDPHLRMFNAIFGKGN